MGKNTSNIDSLNDSSELNRRHISIFLIFLVYAFVTVYLTTDQQLLIPESKTNLPILNVELPLKGFYAVTPLLILVMHLNILFNLCHHNMKLSNCSNKNIFLLTPFMFNYQAEYKKVNLKYFNFLKLINWLTIYGLPLSILIYIQWKFSAYLDLVTTSWHFFLVLLESVMIFIYSPRIINQALPEEGFDSFKRIFPYKKWSLSLFKTHIVIVLGLIFSLLNISNLIFLKYENFKRLIIPNIDLSKENLVASQPSDEIIKDYILREPGKDIEEIKTKAWLDIAQGLGLQGRDLRFANFLGAKLLKADMGKTKLQKADLRGADLRGEVNFKEAHLEGANLEGSLLEGADFRKAHLQGANLNGAKLQNTSVNYAELQGANLKKAILHHANFTGAKIQGANLTGAELIFDENTKSFLLGADLSGATLNNAWIMFADFRSSDFSMSEFKNGYLIQDLFYALRNDGLIIINSTIETLNELLKSSKLYEQVRQKKPDKIPSKNLHHLKEIYDKSKTRNDLKRLNRSLLEEFYPQDTPKNNVSKTIMRGTYFGKSHIECIENLEEADIEGILFDYEYADKSGPIKELKIFQIIAQVTSTRPMLINTPISLQSYPHSSSTMSYLEGKINNKHLEKNCNNSTTIALLKSKSDYSKFIIERQKLACADSYIAEGMLQQDIGPSKEKVNSEIVTYMQENCTEKLIEINKRGKVKVP